MSIVRLWLFYFGHLLHTMVNSKGNSLFIPEAPMTRIIRQPLPSPSAVSVNSSDAPLEARAASRITYYDGQTIATVDYAKSGNITSCNLIEVSLASEVSAVLGELRHSSQVRGVGLRQMLEIISACQASDDLPRRIYRTPGSVWSMLNGILPGTKWCGIGDIARSYDDLGPETDLDKCCRAHDHCPTKIKGFKKRYGLINWSFYTKSHCDCDTELYDCLKRVDNSLSSMLGNFYFNVIQVQCVEEDHPQRCISGTGLSCVWERDYSQPKRMQFKNVDRKF